MRQIMKKYCIDCGKIISQGHEHCRSCANKGENNNNYKTGESLKKHYCIDCNTEISRKAIKCRSCSHKITGKYCIKHYCKDCNKEISRPDAIRCSKCQQERQRGKLHPNYKNGLPKCIDCGKELTNYIAQRCHSCAGKYISITSIAFKNRDLMGINAPNWQGGLSFLPYSSDWTESLREQIRDRDNHECQLCNKSEQQELKETKQKLSVHHIDYNKEHCVVENLISLCFKCHLKTNINRDFWCEYFIIFLKEAIYGEF